MTAKTAYIFFIPGLWADLKDYNYFLSNLKDFYRQKGYKIKFAGVELSEFIKTSKNIIKDYSYKGSFELAKNKLNELLGVQSYSGEQVVSFNTHYSQKSSTRRLAGNNILIIVGHSLGGAVALALGSYLGSNKDFPIKEVEVLALSPAGVKDGRLSTVFNYWFVLPLKHLITRSPTGSVMKNIINEAKIHGVLIPFIHFYKIVYSPFLESFKFNTVRKKVGHNKLDSITEGIQKFEPNIELNTSNITYTIVYSRGEDVISESIQKKIIKIVKPNTLIYVNGPHAWPLIPAHVTEFFKKYSK